MENNNIHSDIMRSLGRIEGSVTAIQSDIKDVKTKADSYSARINFLENTMGQITVKMAVMWGVATTIIVGTFEIVRNKLIK